MMKTLLVVLKAAPCAHVPGQRPDPLPMRNVFAIEALDLMLAIMSGTGHAGFAPAFAQPGDDEAVEVMRAKGARILLADVNYVEGLRVASRIAGVVKAVPLVGTVSSIMA